MTTRHSESWFVFVRRFSRTYFTVMNIFIFLFLILIILILLILHYLLNNLFLFHFYHFFIIYLSNSSSLNAFCKFLQHLHLLKNYLFLYMVLPQIISSSGFELYSANHFLQCFSVILFTTPLHPACILALYYLLDHTLLLECNLLLQ